MVKRFLNYLSPALWSSTLSVYGSGKLWREVRQQAARSRWAEVTAAIAFLWLLGLLGLSFVLLHGERNALLPPGALALARGLQTMLRMAATPSTAAPGRWGLGLVGLGAWFCLVAGTRKLVQLITGVAGSNPTSLAIWRDRLLPWGITLLGLGVIGLVFSLVGSAPDAGAIASRWGVFIRLGRWVLAIGIGAAGLALVYRLTPQRWLPGLGLWPGVRVVLVLGLGILGLRHWGLSWLTRQAIAYDLLLALCLNLMTLYGLVLLVPVGAQINLSLLRYRGSVHRSWGRPIPTPPPSFDSFKIKRRD
ncbi:MULTISPECIES: hypothetical protein [Cyanophyceae]|uniref:hypothetical protein n=1 Tax=Cyanophyceae TaxID=3028117 RepID=UPI00168492B6|nr:MULTISPECIES: hypothetical protein [Cyanophyceae]MBD1917673.1 hypothetical protein [Phormidium sp. FACHB-77]MBD2031141.1 hypothetical protein [Phormidium sp. FACHB-322]MBD2053570.1 hypothetical protein [Leptolyngbya sp. FACHB-60]